MKQFDMKQFALLGLLPMMLLTSAMAAETKTAATSAEQQKMLERRHKFQQERQDALKKNPAEHQKSLAKRQKHQQTMQEHHAKLRETKDPAQHKLLLQKMDESMKANTPPDMMPVAAGSKLPGEKKLSATPASAK